MEPFISSPWAQPGTVQGFMTSPPNGTLLRFVEEERTRCATPRVLDLGCGAGRNAGPLADSGLTVLGIDLSWPMLRGAVERGRNAGGRLVVAQCPMDRIPARDRSFDIVIAHGIWNLARSSEEFRRGIREAARVSRRGAALFVFTFSRHTLPDDAAPVHGETFVFNQFSGEPQCFPTETQLLTELAIVGFAPDRAVPFAEHNRRGPRQLATGGPVIFEGAFRFLG